MRGSATISRSAQRVSHLYVRDLRMDLKQGRGFARIEESLEMRERLADWSCFVHLAHKTPTARVETGLKSRRRLNVGCGVRLRSTDFESIHYSAGVSLRVIGGREHIRIETVQDTFVAFFLLVPTSKKLLKKCLKCLEVLLGAFRESKGTDH